MTNIAESTYQILKRYYDDFEPYYYFDKYTTAHIIALKENPNKYSQRQNIITKSFIEHSYFGFNIKERKIISIDEDLVPLIEDTKPNFEDLRLKYPAMFINKKFNIDGNIINGFMIIDTKEIMKTNKVRFEDRWESNIRVLAVILNTKDKYEFYMIEPLIPFKYDIERDNGLNTDKEIKDMQKISKTITSFAANLIQLMVNDEKDIKYIDIPESEKRNKRRAKKGKPPSKDITIMRIGGDLKRYASKYSKDRASCDIRYYVGGFFRHYNSDYYVNKKGTKEWIYPFYRNEGASTEKIVEKIRLKRGGK